MRSLKALDVFAKSVPEVTAHRSAAGGVLSLLSITLLVLLFLLETAAFLWQDLERDVKVEPYERERKLRLDLNISLHYVPCEAITVDYEDSMGSHYTAYSIHLLELDSMGEVLNETQVQDLERREEVAVDRGMCGSCYGAELLEDQCCDTCDEVFDSYARKGWSPPKSHTIAQCRRQLSEVHGCRVFGHFMLKEVPGAVHLTFPKRVSDLQHTVHHLQFRDYEHPEAQQWTPAACPLDTHTSQSGNQHLYVLKLTRAKFPSGLRFFEMAAHFRSHRSAESPTLFFQYDIEPVSTEYRQRRTVLQFLVSLCGVIGGVAAFAEMTAILIG